MHVAVTETGKRRHPGSKATAGGLNETHEAKWKNALDWRLARWMCGISAVTSQPFSCFKLSLAHTLTHTVLETGEAAQEICENKVQRKHYLIKQ